MGGYGSGGRAGHPLIGRSAVRSSSLHIEVALGKLMNPKQFPPNPENISCSEVDLAV